MKLKLQLVRDREVIFEIPLTPMDWPKKQLENELETMEQEFQRFSKIFDALSNETRLRMMRRLMEEEDSTVRFADFMQDLDLNPKLVWENTKKLTEGGFLEKRGRGKYSCSESGQRTFIMMSLALRHLLKALEEF